jgi:hypothetical protein
VPQRGCAHLLGLGSIRITQSLVRAACVTVGTVSANCLSRTRTATNHPPAGVPAKARCALIFLNALAMWEKVPKAAFTALTLQLAARV